MNAFVIALGPSVVREMVVLRNRAALVTVLPSMSHITSRIIRSRRRCGDRVLVNAVPRRLATLLLISGIVLVRGSTAAVPEISPDPFAWLRPGVTVDAAARGRLARGEVVVQILPAC